MIASALLAAAVLLVAVGLIHSVLGERALIGPLLAPDKRRGLLEKSGFARATLRFAWHLTSIAWWGFAAILVTAALAPGGGGSAVLAIIGATFLATGVVTGAASRGRHLAWPVFVAIGLLCLIPLF